MILYWFYHNKKLGGALIIESKIIYIFENEEKIAPSILTSKDHLSTIRTNVPFLKVDGPNVYHG